MIEKRSVSPCDVNILDGVSVYRTFMALIIFVGIPYKPRISNILVNRIESFRKMNENQSSVFIPGL